MSKRCLYLLAVSSLICGCTGGPGGATAPADEPVTKAKVDKMTPDQKAAYNAATLSRDRALAATQGKGPLASRTNGQ